VEIAPEMAAWQGAEKLGGAKGCGKAANPAGFPLSYSLGDYGRLTENRTFHLLRRGDI
jgi:hypothetical protein